MATQVQAWVFFVGLCGLLVACDGVPPDASTLSQSTIYYQLPLVKVEQKTFPIVFSAPGTVVPQERLQVASRISGFIHHVFVDEGERVEADTVLVEIDDAQVEAAIRGAEAALSAARVDLLDAQEDMERFRVLTQTQALAEDQLRDAQVRVAQTQARVAQAQADLDAKRQDRQYARITSPVRAQVRERLRDPGDLVTLGDPILRLDVLGPMELEVFIPVTRVDAVSVGQPVEIELGSIDERLTGQVTSVVHSADPVTRRCKVRIALPEDTHLAPGQFGRIHLVLGQELVTVLPAPAVVTRAGIEGVFTMEVQDTVRFRSVRLGRRWKDYRELLAGIDVGAHIVLQPTLALRDGDRVQQNTRDGP